MIKKESRSDKVFLYWCYIMAAIAFAITLYPFIYVFSCSVSEHAALLRQEVWLFPKGFSLLGYGYILRDGALIKAYYNSIWYTVVGTAINIVMTTIAAYPLSKKKFIFKKTIMFFIIFTMFFSGGLIPSFINITQLGLYNTRWAIVLPGAVGVWYIIISRTFFQAIPDELAQAAHIDGAGQFAIFMKIILPLSKPLLAILTLFYAVGHWNAWFGAMIYVPDKTLQPVQLYLRRVLIDASLEYMHEGGGLDAEFAAAGMGLMEQVKYAMIIIVILPIICVYPFLQKYFVQGVMIGSLKG